MFLIRRRNLNGWTENRHCCAPAPRWIRKARSGSTAWPAAVSAANHPAKAPRRPARRRPVPRLPGRTRKRQSVERFKLKKLYSQKRHATIEPAPVPFAPAPINEGRFPVRETAFFFSEHFPFETFRSSNYTAPVVSRKKCCFSTRFGPGDAVPRRAIYPPAFTSGRRLPREKRRRSRSLHPPDKSALGEGWGAWGEGNTLVPSQGGFLPPNKRKI